MNKAYLGVRGKTFEHAGVQGVQILEVFPDSPAAMAGLRSHLDTVQNQGQPSNELAGHLIVGANGHAIRSEEDLARIIARSAPGDVMQVIVTAADGSSREDFLIVLDEAPSVSSPVTPERK
jgi:S1-C subfamily serine protease